VKANPEVPWKEMTGLRHKLIHDYFEVDLDIVWQLLSLYGHDEFRPSYHLGPFTETEWGANVVVDAQQFLADDRRNT
jgi:hypothetical protein